MKLEVHPLNSLGPFGIELPAASCLKLLWGMLCPWLRNVFPHVSDKVNICDAKGIVPGTSMSLDTAGKLKAVLENDWPATKFIWHLSFAIFGRGDFFWVFNHGYTCFLSFYLTVWVLMGYFVNELSLLLLRRSFACSASSLDCKLPAVRNHVLLLWFHRHSTDKTPSALLFSGSDKKCGGEKKRKLKCFKYTQDSRSQLPRTYRKAWITCSRRVIFQFIMHDFL